MKIPTLLLFLIFLPAVIGEAFASTYTLPANSSDSVIAQFDDNVALTRVEQDETLLDVARRFLLGQTEIVRLNPNVDRWLVKKGEAVCLPNRRILPDTPRDGIALNIAEYRLYYYPPPQKGTPPQVISYALGIGRMDWKTPLGKTHVVGKVKDPAWHPPESIRREHAANGDLLPPVVLPGPHNPLGAYMLRLAIPGGYLIHDTDIDKIYGIGMQITHGCVRLYPEDIEAHPDLEGETPTQDQRHTRALNLIRKVNGGSLPKFDEQTLKQALLKLDGVPVPIYQRLSPSPLVKSRSY